MRILLAAALVALLAVAPSANADHLCDGAGWALVDVAGAAYVAVDMLLPQEDVGFLAIYWIYAESNGEPGLQRGGVSLFGDADWCQNSSNPDLLVY